MRVVSWNMAHWSHRSNHEAAWRWVLESLEPDILLAQECVVPDWVARDRTVIWSRAYPKSKQAWGTALVSGFPCKPARVPGVDEWLAALPRDAPDGTGPARVHQADGWIASARVTLPEVGEALVASVHNPASPIDRERLKDIDITPMRLKLNPDLWLLDVLFFHLRQSLGRPLVVGGDFNYSRLLDITLGKGKPRGNNEFFDRIASEGFVSLHRKFHDDDERTFFHARRAHHQLDYLYADASVAALATACIVHRREDVLAFSDHSPLVAEFAL